MSTEHIYDRFQPLYSELAPLWRTSELRDLLSVTDRPDIISFAGGLPYTPAHNLERVSKVVGGVLLSQGAEALQYGPTEGDQSLKAKLVGIMQREGLTVDPGHILITTGSQQALELLSRLFIDRGDTIITAAPSYVGALQSFQSKGPRVVGVPLDDKGIRSDELRDALERLDREGTRPKFLYLVPNFQNPAGVTLSADRRREVLELASERELLIIEDNPYGLLRFQGDMLAPLAAKLPAGVVYLGTLSKIISPGLRLGWIVSPAPIMDKLIMLKQSADLCSSSLTQKIAVAVLEAGLSDEFVNSCREIYRSRLDTMLAALEKHFPREARWTRPQGGLFVWVTLPPYLDTSKMLPLAIERKVAFVPGVAFYPDRSGQNRMRLNFSYPEEDLIREGIKRLGKVVKSEMELYRSLGITERQSPKAN